MYKFKDKYTKSLRKRNIHLPYRIEFQQGGSIGKELLPHNLVPGIGKKIDMERILRRKYLYNRTGGENVFSFQDGSVIRPTGGPYEYKKEGDNYYTKRRDSSDWITLQGDSLNAVKSNIFKSSKTSRNEAPKDITRTYKNEVLLSSDLPSDFYGNPIQQKRRLNINSSTYIPTYRDYNKAGSYDNKSIKNLQKGLNDLGYEVEENGIYGNNTKTALSDYLSKTSQGKSDKKEPLRLGKVDVCTEEGCAEFVTNELIRLSGKVVNEDSREKFKKFNATGDAWDRPAAMEGRGASYIFNSLDENLSSKDNLYKAKIGDVVALNRNSYSSNDKPTQLASKTKFKNQHLGYVAGYDKDGTPVIRHNIHGKVFHNRVDDISNYGTEGVYKYTPSAILRSSTEKAGTGIPGVKGKVENPSGIESDFTNELLKNFNNYRKDFNLSDIEAKNLTKLANGVLSAESKNQKNPIVFRKIPIISDYIPFAKIPIRRRDKEAIANIVSDNPSRGVSQIKDSVFINADGSPTLAGRYKGKYNIKDLQSPKDSANATMLNLIQNYLYLKKKNPNLSTDDLLYKTAASYKYSPYGNIPFLEDKTNAYANKVIKEGENVIIDPTTLVNRKKGGNLTKIVRKANLNIPKGKNGLVLPTKPNKIVDGVFHSRRNKIKEDDITTKGVPVVSMEEGNIVQHAEVEKNELVFSKENTDKIHEMIQANQMIDLGKYVANEILNNTEDSRDKVLK